MEHIKLGLINRFILKNSTTCTTAIIILAMWFPIGVILGYAFFHFGGISTPWIIYASMVTAHLFFNTIHPHIFHFVLSKRRFLKAYITNLFYNEFVLKDLLRDKKK